MTYYLEKGLLAVLSALDAMIVTNDRVSDLNLVVTEPERDDR